LRLRASSSAMTMLREKLAIESRAATNPIPLPEPKPRAVREQIVVTAIRSREITQAHRSSVRHCEDAF
jgi:hypothetical protein